MSRKKLQLSELNLSTMSGRIAYIRVFNGLNQEEFAEKLNTSKGNISSWETGTYQPSFDKIVLISELFQPNSDWLLHGKGEMLSAAKSEGSNGMGDELSGLLDAAERVLKSNTHYARSLSANIVSFEKGLKSEQDHEQRIARLERRDGSIRADDPNEKKEELLKLRIV